jgi:hypothetical protein
MLQGYYLLLLKVSLNVLTKIWIHLLADFTQKYRVDSDNVTTVRNSLMANALPIFIGILESQREVQCHTGALV